MSLLEKAKKAAKKADDQKKREIESEVAARKFREESLDKLSKAVLSGLKELNNVKTPKGTLKLVRNRSSKTKTIGNLRLTKRPNDLGDVDLLYIDAEIKSGTRCYGEGCEDIPYTEATLDFYVKNPPTSEVYGYAQTKNWEVAALGLQTYFHEYVTHWNEKELPEKLEKLAEWLAPLFRET